MSNDTPTLHAILDPEILEALPPHLWAPAEAADPWYLKVPITLGAWVASFFLCTFLASFLRLLGGLEEGPLFLLGCFSLGASVAIHLKSRESLFWDQLSLALSGGGHLAVIAAAAWAARDSWPIPVVSAILCLALYLVQDGAAHRFLAALSTQYAVLAWCWVEGLRELVLPFSAAIGAAAILLLSLRPQARSHRPAILSLAFGSATVLLWSSHFHHFEHFSRGLGMPLRTLASVILSLGLWRAAAWFFGDWRPLLRSPFSLVTTTLVGLALLGTPGVILALALLVLGFLRRDLPLTVLGTLFLPLFLSAYYYSLELDLFTKSLLLMASGVTLLLARLALPRRSEA